LDYFLAGLSWSDTPILLVTVASPMHNQISS